MAVIAETDISGYRIGEEIVCPACIENEDQEHLKKGQIITDQEIQSADLRYFCDRCEEEL